LNCRSLGYARDDKGEGDTSIWCDGSNDNLMDVVHPGRNLSPASQGAPNDTVRRVGSATTPLKPKEGLNGPPQAFLVGELGNLSLNLPQVS